MVFYRKYRPQRIEDLDSAHVRETLVSVLSAKELPHAFLFTGPKGLGKTSTARILAKAIDCEKRAISNQQSATSLKEKKLKASGYALDVTVEPCNECDQCLSITNGSNLDVMEIDAASNRGIDEIRDLRDKINLAPISAKKKIYIIDEVHMLTTEAFNALLKTLEEPPDHAVFILCTTEMHKVPETILSRCFHIAFSVATPEELVRSFERIVKGEEMTADPKALLEIAKLAGGSFRDGTKILEEVAMLLDGKKITKELVENKYQVSSIQYQVSNILKALAKKDAKESLQIIQKVTEQGIDVRFFIEQLINVLHENLLEQIGVQGRGPAASFPPANAPSKSSVRVVGNPSSGVTPLAELKELISFLTKAYGETKYSVIPTLPLELAVIEYCIDEEVSQAEQVPQVSRGDDGKQTVDALKKSQKNIAIKNVIASHVRGESTVVKKSDSAATASADSSGESRQTSIAKRMGTHQDFFDEFIQEVKLKNNTLAGVLRGCIIVSFENGTLLLQTPYTFHKERLEEDKAHILLEDVARSISGKKVKVSVELKVK